MNLKRCKNGHYYDADKYENCPHCGTMGMGQPNETVAFSQEESVTTSNLEVKPSSLQDAVNSAMSQAAPPEDEQKTVGFFSKSIGKEPVVGWLVAVEGKHFGEDFRLKAGRNFIGRDTGMDVCISKDGTVSRNKHAVIIFEPKQNVYLVQPGDSKELFYLNEEVVLNAQKIVRNDILQIGETKLMFVPCCDESFSWNELAKKQTGEEK